MMSYVFASKKTKSFVNHLYPFYLYDESRVCYLGKYKPNECQYFEYVIIYHESYDQQYLSD